LNIPTTELISGKANKMCTLLFFKHYNEISFICLSDPAVLKQKLPVAAFATYELVAGHIT
jgi:hypothetical protein